MIEILNEDNFLSYCSKHYNFKRCIDENEFQDDLKRIRYIKKLLTRYKQSGDLKERLILNHITVLVNVFGPIHASRILFFKFKDMFAEIKPFMILLNILPEYYVNIDKNHSIYYTDDYPMDKLVVEKLRRI